MAIYFLLVQDVLKWAYEWTSLQNYIWTNCAFS